jgi:hypothetical protein
MKILLPAFLLCLAAATPVLSQDGTPADSGSAPAAVSAASLLPSRLGPMERLLWGEHGAMRRLGMPLTEENREKEIFLRRGLLTAHQVGGFLTLGAMTATAVTGQMMVNDPERDLRGRKVLLVNATIISYFATALLAAVTPPPMHRRDQWSSISWHKLLATVHFTGMVVTPILGYRIEGDEDRRSFHQYAGYATLAAFTGAMIVVTF